MCAAEMPEHRPDRWPVQQQDSAPIEQRAGGEGSHDRGKSLRGWAPPSEEQAKRNAEWEALARRILGECRPINSEADWRAYCAEQAKRGFHFEWNGPTPGTPEHKAMHTRSISDAWRKAVKRFLEMAGHAR